MKKYALYIVLFVLVIAGIIASQKSTPKPVDYKQTFSRNDKIPYGTKIFYDLVTARYRDGEIKIIDDPLYKYFNSHAVNEGNMFFIDKDFLPDKIESDLVLKFAEMGNNVFISAEEISIYFEDTLKIHVTTDIMPTLGGDMSFNLSNPNLRAREPYSFKINKVGSYFAKLDSTNISVLGTAANGNADFIRVAWGSGHIYISAIPVCFANIGMLYGRNAEYADKCLSYMPKAKNIYWNGNEEKNGGASASLLSFILSQPPLTYAYYLLIVSLIIYVFFEGKRRQRIIPIILPLKNSTLEFAETIGRLYFQSANHKDLSEKKTAYFYDFLRNKLYIKSIEPGEKLYQRLSSQSGISETEIKDLFRMIDAMKSKTVFHENDLTKLNAAIDKFYKHF
jgi:hypothetical protein